jgi:plasmid replication initiation protein
MKKNKNQAEKVKVSKILKPFLMNLVEKKRIYSLSQQSTTSCQYMGECHQMIETYEKTSPDFNIRI